MTVFQTGRSVPPTTPRGADSHQSRPVFHGVFSAGEVTRPTYRFHTHTTWHDWQSRTAAWPIPLRRGGVPTATNTSATSGTIARSVGWRC